VKLRHNRDYPVIREVSHQYENYNDNEHVITLCFQIMMSPRAISFRQVRDVPNEHDFVDLLRYVDIFRLHMQYHLIIFKRIDDVFVIVIVFSYRCHTSLLRQNQGCMYVIQNDLQQKTS
jgi:hypothetical protein